MAQATQSKAAPALPPPVEARTSGSDVLAATVRGLAVAGLLILAIFVGSRGLKDFDPALVSYAGASVFAAFGIGYRYSMWLRRPPTRLYWLRGLQFILSPRHLPENVLYGLRMLWENFFVQSFIERRAHLRWAAHWLISWGCLLAAAVTFPLSFGWIRFETARDSQKVYEMFVSGIRIASFPIDSIPAFLTFNLLNIAAVMVIAGVVIALSRRAVDRGALAVQQFVDDLMPLILLFTVSITGLLLTVSMHFLRGQNYVFLSQLHAIAVIFTLLYLPFGKFFHIFQRPAQVGVKFYRRDGARIGPATCRRCGEEFATSIHVGDMKTVEEAVGVRYQLPGGGHYQDVCPACRRKNLALIQDGMWRAARRESSGQEDLRRG
jgi:hypothetical protein